MGKKVVVCIADGLVLLFIGIILIILLTGGFTFILGPLSLKAHSLTNPLLILGGVLILRRWLAGSFFQGFSGKYFVMWAEYLVRRFAESSSFRKWILLVWCLALLMTVLTLINKPLQPGLTVTCYDNVEWSGTPLLTTRDTALDLTVRKQALPGRIENYSLEWSGVIFIPESGQYQFTTASDDGSDLALDNQLVVDNRGFHGFGERTGTVDLEKGFHLIRLRYMQGGMAADFRAYWKQPDKKRQLLVHADLFQEKSATVAQFRMYQIRRILLPLLIAFWGLVIVITAIGIVPSIPTKCRFWRDLSPLTVKLLIFFFLNSVVINLILIRSGYLTTLYYTGFFINSPTHARNDSWQSMHRALEYLRNPHDDLLYEQVFFQEGFKLQYPPTALLVFKPFTGVSLSTLASGANFAAWLGVIATIGILVRIFSLSLQKYIPSAPEDEGRVRGSPPAEKIARLALSVCFSLTFYPLVRSFQLGQIQTWIYCLFILALWAWMADRKALAGCLIGLICMLKPPLGLLVFWGMLRKEWRFVSGILVTAGIVLSISLGVFGLANHLNYLQVLAYLSQHGEMYYPNQSVNGLLHRLFLIGTETIVNPFVFPPFNPWVYVGTLVSSVLCITAALFWKRGQYKQAETTDFAIAALSFTMASPIAWEHHYGILLPIFAVMLPATLASRLKRRGAILMAASFALCSNYYQITDRLVNTPFNFLQSYLFFGALVFLGYLYRLKNAQHASIRSILVH